MLHPVNQVQRQRGAEGANKEEVDAKVVAGASRGYGRRIPTQAPANTEPRVEDCVTTCDYPGSGKHRATGGVPIQPGVTGRCR